ncbi:unnamed protein product [Hydatigera taeniaeformis]|uniref:Uncharacterized protein n=1 Tax=Hydatigena taeniaeformis TaxID=6205 RepID=A0A0R3X9Q6_HYDTA|nr:unnamed protein product [Hydatigera taeniaeformis]
MKQHVPASRLDDAELVFIAEFGECGDMHYDEAMAVECFTLPEYDLRSSDPMVEDAAMLGRVECAAFNSKFYISSSSTSSSFFFFFFFLFFFFATSYFASASVFLLLDMAQASPSDLSDSNIRNVANTQHHMDLHESIPLPPNDAPPLHECSATMECPGTNGDQLATTTHVLQSKQRLI